MKHISRRATPECLDNGIPSVYESKKQLYRTTDPWNGFCQKKINGSFAKDIVRETLLQMSDYECAFCGKKLDPRNVDMQVDHILPQKPFKLLSLCWDNMLPLCGNCNNRKRNFIPESLKNVQFSEPSISCDDYNNTVAFDKEQVFGICVDRLIDPSFDDPEEHIRFDPASCQFEALSPIGVIMVEYIFYRIRSLHEQLNVLSESVKKIVDTHPHPEESIRIFLINISGYSYYVRAFYKYWLALKSIKS
jgi:hypothetical protein